MRVLIISISLGAGHDQSAAEMCKRLVAQGCEVEVVDVLSMYPFALGGLARRVYGLQLKYWPQSYERAFQSYGRIKGRFRLVNSALIQRYLQRLLIETRPDVVVCNNPHAIGGAGLLALRGKLRVPLIAQVLDAGVHPLWINDGGAHLVVHEASVQDAIAMGSGTVRVIGPMVKSERRTEHDAANRRVYVSAGSWAVGDLAATIDGVLGAGFTPVVMCGRNSVLLNSLSSRTDVEARGWTEDVASVMRSCVAAVDNAGGLSGWQALNLGIPVVGFKPIAGHGLLNLAKMAEAGIITLANTRADLAVALTAATTAQVPTVFSETNLKAVLQDLIGADRL